MVCQLCYLFSSSFLFCQDTTKALDLSRLISGPDRYVYGFGFSKFNERPAIVPKKTLDCIDQSQSTTETLNEEKKPVTVPAEK